MCRYNTEPVSYTHLADQLNITRQALSNYEVGKRIPDIFELIRMAEIFKVSVDEIIGREV